MDTKTFTKTLKMIGTTGVKLDGMIQECGLFALEHAEAHQDLCHVNGLYNALPKGTRKSALTGWLLAFGKVKANTGKDKAERPFAFDKEKETDLDGAAETPWFEFKPDAAPDEVFDLQKAMMALLKKARKLKADGKQIAHAEMLAELEKAATPKVVETAQA